MELYLLRHAIAVDRDLLGHKQDSERPLTPKGEAKMRKIAEGMRVLEVEPDVILASPYVRARRTAEIAAAALGARTRLLFSDHLAPGGDPERLVRTVVEDHPGARSVLLVGHEPGMSTLMSVLLSGGEDVAILFKKGGLARLTTENLRHARCATLEWLLTPSQLADIGRSPHR